MQSNLPILSVVGPLCSFVVNDSLQPVSGHHDLLSVTIHLPFLEFYINGTM